MSNPDPDDPLGVGDVDFDLEEDDACPYCEGDGCDECDFTGEYE